MTACDDAVLIVINTAGCKSKTNETTSLQHNDIISRRRAHSAQYASGELLGQTASLGGVG